MPVTCPHWCPCQRLLHPVHDFIGGSSRKKTAQEWEQEQCQLDKLFEVKHDLVLCVTCWAFLLFHLYMSLPYKISAYSCKCSVHAFMRSRKQMRTIQGIQKHKHTFRHSNFQTYRPWDAQQPAVFKAAGAQWLSTWEDLLEAEHTKGINKRSVPKSGQYSKWG